MAYSRGNFFHKSIFLATLYGVKPWTMKVTGPNNLPEWAGRPLTRPGPTAETQYQVSKPGRKSACSSAPIPRPWIVFLIVSCFQEIHRLSSAFNFVLFPNRRESPFDPYGWVFWRTDWSLIVTSLSYVIFKCYSQAKISHGASWKHESTHLLVFQQRRVLSPSPQE